MRAVWSFWTKPFATHHHSAWPSEMHHLLSWVLSVETAGQHYDERWLFTDDAGAVQLIERLGLRFTHVSTALNELGDYDPEWWTLGKIYTYALQTEPFVHIDSDVFLWKPLPPRVANAPVFAQNPVPFRTGAAIYQPEKYEEALRHPGAGWLPSEWKSFRQTRARQRGESCGIVGGRHVEFIHHYATQALRLLQEPTNQPGLAALANKRLLTVTLEEYLLAACVEYHRQRAQSPFRGVNIAYLFDKAQDFWNPTLLARAGYTHLMTGAKRNRTLATRLVQCVRRDYPAFFARTLRLVDTAGHLVRS